MHALKALDYDLIHDIAYDTQNTTAVTLSGYLCSGALSLPTHQQAVVCCLWVKKTYRYVLKGKTRNGEQG